jgi:hypothetical protein
VFLGRPDALILSASDAVKRKLLAAFFSKIWVDDDSHEVTISRELQPLVADIRDAVLNGTAAKTKNAGDISDASSAEQLTH